MRRTCYYGNGRTLDQLSLPLTRAVVEYFAKNAPFDDLDIQYASDVSHAGAVSPSMLIVAMIYLERMRLTNKDHFESSDPNELFTSALLCASKFLYDEAESEFVYNDEWALSCSRTLGEVNKSEIKFLSALQWNIMAHEKDFHQMLRKMEIAIARRECERRGFASYSDLSVLASGLTEIWNEILLAALAVVGLATLAYTATVVGLYTCSLYSSTADVPRVSASQHIAPFSQLPLILPSSNVLLELETAGTAAEANEIEPAAKIDQDDETKQNAIVPTLPTRLSHLLTNANWKNESFCGREMTNDEGLNLLLTPWTTWFYHTKSALAIWSV